MKSYGRLPRISIVITLITNGNPSIVLNSLKKLAYPKHLYEIIIVEGNQPSRQRNKAIKHAKGELIYFLDDDSQVRSNSLNIIATLFCKKDIDVIGGPCLTPKSSDYFNKVVGSVLETYFGAYRMRYKWSIQSENKSFLDYEFIGSNLAIRKNVIEEAGGYDEKFYPNEETELLRRLHKSGYKIRYSRRLFIYQTHRKNWRQLVKRFHNYGRGRAKQIMKSWKREDFIFILPIAFLFYLASFLFVRSPVFFVPFVIYLLLAFSTSFLSAIKYRNISLIFTQIPVFLTIHLSYGFGLIREFISSLLNIENLRVKERKFISNIRITKLNNNNLSKLDYNFLTSKI